MTDAFANLVGPIFQHVITLQRRLEMGESPRLEAERGQIMALLNTAEQQAGTSGQTMLDFDVAKHALVYWIDEILVNSAWGQDSGWREHILEWDIFQERLRADRFYEKAQEAETLPGTDALETFFLCAALGFRGQFVDNRAGLLKWSERTYARL